MLSTHQQDVRSGERFEFGKNWKNFLTLLNEDRIKSAEESLVSYVGDVKGKRFIDVGSGSGLFSLAARRMGAIVFSFDYDPQSFACTRELKERYFAADDDFCRLHHERFDLCDAGIHTDDPHGYRPSYYLGAISSNNSKLVLSGLRRRD